MVFSVELLVHFLNSRCLKWQRQTKHSTAVFRCRTCPHSPPSTDLAPGKFTLATLQAEASTCSGTCGRATTRQCSATTAAAKSAVWSPKGLGRDPMALDTRRIEDAAGDVHMRRCQNLQPVDCVSQEKTL